MPMLGKKHTAEAIANMRMARKKNPPWNKGKKLENAAKYIKKWEHIINNKEGTCLTT